MGSKKEVKKMATVAEQRKKWQVNFHKDFRSNEFSEMDKEQRKALLAAATALEEVGPSGGRPLIDTLSNSKHKNMKELRYDAHDGAEIWRAAFAFDPQREAVILVAGDKQGIDEKLFYERLIEKADKRFGSHLEGLKKSSAAANSESKSKGKGN